MVKIWKIKKKAPTDFYRNFAEFPKPIVQLFFNRGLMDKDQAAKFLNPRMKDAHDPALFSNIIPAAKRIMKAIEDEEKIAIYGDYDTDGICSAAVLTKSFERLGVKNFHVFIPNRYKDAYGLTMKKVEQMANLGIKLIITVDCGISDVKEVEHAKSLGMEVIVVDHHLPHKDVPEAIIIDAHQEGDSYPFKYLSATGVVYKLVKILTEIMGFPFQDSLEREIIDLVALATIADMMPMIDENRVLVKQGLEQLKDTQNIGLQALLKEAKIDEEKEYNSTHVGFTIAPRLNAVGRVRHKTPSGRLENVDYSFELLTTKNKREADMWAKKVGELNTERQKITKKVYDQINKEIKDKGGPEKIIFFGSPDWPKGIVGLIAGKLKNEWNRPVFLYSKEDGYSVGSARSIPSYNLVEAMDRAGDILIEPGGHQVAAGFRLTNDNIERFKEFLAKEAENLSEKDLIPTVEIEAELQPSDITPAFWQLYQRFEPFGKDNFEPIFLIRNMETSNVRLVGNGNKHLKLSVEKNGKVFNAIGFGLSDKIDKLSRGTRVDIAFRLKKNEWQGREYLDFDLVDINPVK